MYLLNTKQASGHHGIACPCDRLEKHGKADLIAEVNPSSFHQAWWVSDYVDKMSSNALVRLLLKIKCNFFNYHVMNKIIGLMSQKDLVVVLPNILNNIETIHPVPVVTMLEKLPIESAQQLATRWEQKRSPYECMRCGRVEICFRAHSPSQEM